MSHKLKGLVKTAKNVVSHAIKNKEVISTKYEQRMNICQRCLFFRKQFNICTKCGCYMKAKAKLVAAKCPMKKW